MAYVVLYNKNFYSKKELDKHKVSFRRGTTGKFTSRYFTSLSRAKSYAKKKAKEYNLKSYDYKNSKGYLNPVKV